MEENGGGQGPEDYEMAMVVSARGQVAWVPAQAVAQNGWRDALAAVVRQKAWVPAEDAARTGWIPSPDMLFLENHHALVVALRHGWVEGEAAAAVALRHGWVEGEAAAATNVLYLACLRLPAQEVALCRRICRLWRAILDTEDFRLRHHDHSSRTPMPLFLLQDPDHANFFNLRAVDIQGRVSRPVIRFNRDHIHGGEVSIHGSCAGILLVSFGDWLYAFNPCTRRFASLPPLHVAHDIIGFYATTGLGGFRCKVLYHDSQSPCAYWIYTLGTLPSAGRCIGRWAHWFDPALAAGVTYSHDFPPVFFLDFLHWLNSSNSNILRFNTVYETFTVIPPPSIRVRDQDYPFSGRQIFEIDQHLAMTVKHPLSTRVNVWVRSNTTDIWSLRYHINLPVGEINLNGSSHDDVSLFAVAQDRNLLVGCPGILLHCDALGTVVARYQLPGNFTILAAHTIEESLLLHRSILPSLHNQ